MLGAAVYRLVRPWLIGPIWFRRVTTDGFFLCIEARDVKFEAEGTSDLLRSLGSTSVELLED